jgi:hypothetical protein
VTDAFGASGVLILSGLDSYLFPSPASAHAASASCLSASHRSTIACIVASARRYFSRFMGSFDGTVYAFDEPDTATLWRAELRAGIKRRVRRLLAICFSSKPGVSTPGGVV